jgi:lipoate-protein ligase A
MAPLPFMTLRLPTLAANLALDEALLLEAEEGRGSEVLRVWEWPAPAVVLGAGCRLAEDVEEETCRTDAVPILRRASGGGTVLLGRGCLLYSLILAYRRSPALHDITSSYAYIFDRLREALSGLLPDLEHAGTSDLTSRGRKLSGNAQQRKRSHVLHHGTLLYDFNLGLVSRYLRMPARQPEYRQQRDHADFLVNLPASAAQIEQRLCQAWQAETELAVWPAARVQQLVAEKYAQSAWVRRR